jgi:protein SCO1/2
MTAPPRRRRWRAVLAGALLTGAAVAGEGVQIYPALPAGQTSYGGPFSLLDHHGAPFTEANLRGHYSLLYFGYTGCADVCPTSLFNIARALERLGDSGESVEPLFVNLDARRRSLDDLARYVAYFHPRLRGLTGSEEQIAATARAYRVHFQRGRTQGRATLEHSSYIFLLDPQGTPVTWFPHGAEPEDMAATMRHHMHAGAAR